MNDHLFVYGTLLSGAKHPMHHVLARDAEFVGEGFFNGRLCRVAHYPGAVASSEPDDRVFGEIYQLRNVSEALLRLDEYEGCGPAAPTPTEFIRKATFITLADGTRIQAWIYLYNRQVHGLQRIENSVWVLSAAIGRNEVKAPSNDGPSR